MAIDTTPTGSAQRGPDLRVVGGNSGTRADSKRVVQPINDAIAPCLEGIALADEVLATVDRIALALGCDAYGAAVNQANRLGHLARLAREELRRMVGAIEPKKAA